MIYHFILNPKSGRKGKLKNAEDTIKEACQKRKISYHIYYTTCQGDATEYVSSMVKVSPEDRHRFICMGGDGTINEIVNGVPANSNVEFGVIPNGSGNDFIRNFTNKELFTSIEAQLDGETVSLDLIKVNDMYSANMVNIGFDCNAAKEAASLKRFKFVTPGMSYILGVLVCLFRTFGTKMKIVFDDGYTIEDNLTLTAIGNGQFCGGGFCAAPKALLNDGLMDVCVIKKVSRLQFLQLVGDYKAGTYLKNPNALKVIEYRRVSHFKMEFEEPIPICLDGEIKGAKTIDFSVLKDGFNFVIPKGCEMKYKTESDFE
jgi:YegS/Rv2252/BmrU family lipid kinase